MGGGEGGKAGGVHASWKEKKLATKKNKKKKNLMMGVNNKERPCNRPRES